MDNRRRMTHLKNMIPFIKIEFGSFGRHTPISKVFGQDRGLPICWYYIHNFLGENAADVKGRVLEIGDNSYTIKYGGNKVTKSDVLHAIEGNPLATIIGDLTQCDNIPSNSFDCIILTQTLHVIYDMRGVLKNIYRILKPGGVLLATFPGISQISRYDMDRWGDYWRLTTASSKRLFEEYWTEDSLKIVSHGNVLVAASYLYGLSSDDLKKEDMDYTDPDYQVIITVRAVKPIK